MKVLFYSIRSYDKYAFEARQEQFKKLEFEFTESALNSKTVEMAAGYDAVCIFVNDNAKDEKVIKRLSELGVKVIALRCAGFNNVDYKLANKLGMTVVRVPGYSPESIAEFGITLALATARKVHRTYNRVREHNFTLSKLSGLSLYKKTAGIIGYGRIGKCLANITKGFGMNTIAYDPYFTKNGENDTVESVDLNTLYKESDFIFLTVLLNAQTEHMINKTSISKMKKNVLLVNISRGGLINTKDLIEAIKEKKFFGVGLDVYEGEEDVIYTNHEDEILDIPYIDELTSLPNVLVTPHQAFLTDVALEQISLSVCNTLTLYNNKEEIDEKCIVK